MKSNQSESEFLSTFSEAVNNPPSSENLKNLIEMENGPRRDALLLAYCVGHGKNEMKFGTFPKQEVVNSELKAFESLVERQASPLERQLLENKI